MNLKELGDEAKIDPGNEAATLGDDRYAVRLERIECRPRLLVVGDVPRNEVDRTGRQELLELEAAGSAGLPVDFNGDHSDSIRCIRFPMIVHGRARATARNERTPP